MCRGKRRALGGDQKGSVMVEFGLMLPLMVILMVFLMICYEVVAGQIELQVEAYSAMRKKCNDINTPGRGYWQDAVFVKETRSRVVNIPGRMPAIIGVSSVPIKASVCSYAGTMQGRGANQYVNGGDRYYWAPEVFQTGLCTPASSYASRCVQQDEYQRALCEQRQSQ